MERTVLNGELRRFQYDNLFGAGAGAVQFRCVTYDRFRQGWPTTTDEEGFADRMNSITNYVPPEATPNQSGTRPFWTATSSRR